MVGMSCLDFFNKNNISIHSYKDTLPYGELILINGIYIQCYFLDNDPYPVILPSIRKNCLQMFVVHILHQPENHDFHSHLNNMVLVSYTLNTNVHWNFTDKCSVQLSSVSGLLRFRYLLKSHLEVSKASPLLTTGNIFLRLCQSLVSFIHSFLHSPSLKSSPFSKLSLKYLK